MPENHASGGRPKPGTVSFAMWVGGGLKLQWDQAVIAAGYGSKAEWVRAMMATNLGLTGAIGTTAMNGRTV